jgi:hypothetical protein
VPHITLGYVPDGEEVPDLPALAPGSAPQWLADSLLLAFAGEHAEVPLTGKAEVTRALCPVLCAEAEKQIIWYQAAVPGDVDTYGHEITLDEVEDAAHGFMENLGVKFEHGDDISDRARVVENFTMPVTIPKGGTFHGQKVVEPILEGTWMAAIHYHDKEMWKQLSDASHGISWGGLARKVRR